MNVSKLYVTVGLLVLMVKKLRKKQVFAQNLLRVISQVMTSLFANNPSRVVPDYTYFTLKHITLGHFETKMSQSMYKHWQHSRFIQGPLKKWTEHSQELHLLKIHGRGGSYYTPGLDWG